MATRRTRSTERPGAGAAGPARPGLGGLDPLDRLTAVLEQVLNQQQGAQGVRMRPAFKAPSFDGEGDVELFINQFVEVAEANEWDHQSAVLHLRESLKEDARECGRARTLEEMFTTLRGRYGLSPKEARGRLASLKKDGRTTLQAHATEVARLVGIAYRELPEQQQQTMALEIFSGTLGNASLQRHLLAVAADTLEDAVKAAKEFLSVKTNPCAIRTIDETDTEAVMPLSGTGPLDAMMTILQELAKKVEALQMGSRPAGLGQTDRKKNKPIRCWGCGKMGHTRAQCSTHPWTTDEIDQGNGPSPQ